MAAPAIFLLEAIKPIGFLASSALTVLSPVGRAFLDPTEWDALPGFLEDRERIEGLLRQIESKLDGEVL